MPIGGRDHPIRRDGLTAGQPDTCGGAVLDDDSIDLRAQSEAASHAEEILHDETDDGLRTADRVTPVEIAHPG